MEQLSCGDYLFSSLNATQEIVSPFCNAQLDQAHVVHASYAQVVLGNPPAPLLGKLPHLLDGEPGSCLYSGTTRLLQSGTLAEPHQESCEVLPA